MLIVHDGATVEASILAVRAYASNTFASEADFQIGDRVVTKKLYRDVEVIGRGKSKKLKILQEGTTIVYDHPENGRCEAEGVFEAGQLCLLGTGTKKIRIKDNVNWSSHWATYLTDCVLEVHALPANRWGGFHTAPKFYVATPHEEVQGILQSINLSAGLVGYDHPFRGVTGQELGDWLFPEYFEFVPDDTPIGLPYKLIRVPVSHQ